MAKRRCKYIPGLAACFILCFIVYISYECGAFCYVEMYSVCVDKLSDITLICKAK